jgi:hypothetical protein
MSASLSCIELMDGEQIIGHATLAFHDVDVLKSLFIGDTKRQEISTFRERRPLGMFAGFELSLSSDPFTTIRLYKNQLFQHQTLLALVTHNKEVCSVAFDDDEIVSVGRALDAL